MQSLSVRAVKCAENTGDAHVISDKGALLMQVMLVTYAELRSRHCLGADILAGTDNIRETRDRFGSPGFLAAYHAEPTRYDNYLTSGRQLPEKSRR